MSQSIEKKPFPTIYEFDFTPKLGMPLQQNVAGAFIIVML